MFVLVLVDLCWLYFIKDTDVSRLCI